MTKQVQPAFVTAKSWMVQTLFRFDPDKFLDAHDRKVLLERMVATIRQKLDSYELIHGSDYEIAYTNWTSEGGYQIVAEVFDEADARTVARHFDDILIDDASKFNITRL